jgi:NTP pyrophosphatase (non-canonical NTP hydrolase)
MPKANCWLCQGLGGIAVHILWTERRGKILWTAHEYPSDDDHETRPCPACRSLQDLAVQQIAAHGADRYPTVEGQVLKLVEEVGEVARAVLRGNRTNLADEVADVALCVARLSTKIGIDLHDQVEQVVARSTPKPMCPECGKYTVPQVGDICGPCAVGR